MLDLTDQRARETLKRVFGYDAFRPLQDEIVRAILEGRDAFVLMPTGGGKSLCYQLPALLLDGLTVVVSPLIALMKDQVDRLQALGVPAAFINSSLDPAEARARAASVARGEVKLLYVAPERLVMPGFLQVLERVKLAFVAVDEAHCISEWGHDFRPEYRELKQLRARFPGTPLAAFTATATARVQADIVDQLGLQRAAHFRGRFDRPNLFYAVRPKQGAYDQLKAYLRLRPGAGIVYCGSRATTESVAERLRADGFDALAYHAGLEPDDRRRRQEAFARDDVRVVVATIAFGMGIDKPDVRFVIHYDLPKNLEGYYQESGRAGRDGDPSECILFYSYADAVKLQGFVQERTSPTERQAAADGLRRMVDWAESTTCRRRALLAYFDETPDAPADGPGAPCCDRCLQPVELVDYTLPVQMFLSCAKRVGERFGVGHLIDVLRGAQTEKIDRFGHQRLSTYGIGADRSLAEWQHVARELIRAGYARQDAEAYNAVRVTSLGSEVLFKSRSVELARWTPPVSAPRQRKGALDLEAAGADAALFDRLRALRKRLADERRVPPYVIFHDSVLREMAAQLPRSQAQLLRISGVGERKLADYGDPFLREIDEYLSADGSARPNVEVPRDGRRGLWD
ncbi:MAG TPA: DNA helicase RecQ [Chloroflexota bacterium]|jgi:ATP-dependent DNA helicase RecQ